MAECCHYFNIPEGFVVTGRAVKDRLTYLICKFSARNNAENKLSGEGGKQPPEYNILLQDILDLSSDCDYKQDMINKQDC